jgi:hypothetical protein
LLLGIGIAAYSIRGVEAAGTEYIVYIIFPPIGVVVGAVGGCITGWLLARNAGGETDVLFKRSYPELSFFSIGCFSLSAASLFGLLWLGGWYKGGGLDLAFAAASAGLAAVASAAWVVRTVLEVAFHLQEQIRHGNQRTAIPADRGPPGSTDITAQRGRGR